jgi:signal transduction histidine kinase
LIGLRRALWTIGAVGLAVVVAETYLLATSDFAPDPALWLTLNWVIGGGFIAAGLYAWYRRPDNRVGVLMVAAAFAYLVSTAALTEPPLLFTVGSLLGNLFVTVAIHLILAFPSGRLESRLDRVLVGYSYLVTTVGFLPLVLFADPAAAGCPECPENLFLVSDNPSFAEGWGDGLSICGIILLPAVLARLIVRWRAASPPLRRVITPLYAAGGALMVILTALLVAGLADAPHSLEKDLFYAAIIPFGLVPYLYLGSLVRARMLRGGAVGELVSRIGGGLGEEELRRALARALGDPSLELAYWLPDSERYVDSEGRPMDCPPAGSDRVKSDVTLDGRRIAAIVHDAHLLDEPELVHAVGAAAALGLEKQRLEAELRAKIEELREQRSRIIAVGLSERRRMERDLHDGAQQRLVSLALDLRLAQSSLRDDPDSAAQLLASADEELGRALEELRELARGLHPAVLSDRGLDPAVDALASRSPLPVEIETRLGERLPGEVELAAYFVVSEALTNVAKYADASQAVVRLGRENGGIVVEVEDDGIGGADPGRGSGLRGLADRVAALGGDLEIDSAPGAGTTVTAKIPCG